MKGMIAIKAGTYNLSDATRMNIHASDDGAVITFSHKPSGLHAVAVIDEHGAVVRQQIDHRGILRPSTLSFAPSSPSPEPSEITSESRIEVLDTSRPPSSKPKRKAKLIRFTLRYGKSGQKNRPYAVAAYTDGGPVHVLYRLSGDQTERQMRFDGDLVQIGTQVKKIERLTQVEWTELVALPDATNFQIAGRLGLYRKVTADELRALVGEKTFRAANVTGINVPPPSAPPKTAVCPATAFAKFKAKHVSVLNCEPATFDHANGEPATAITISHKDSVEPLTIDLDTTRKLVVSMLVSLWTADDTFAESVLERFPINGGVHHWPSQE